MRKLSNLHSWVRRVSSALALIPAPGRPDAPSVEVLVVSSRCAACFWVSRAASVPLAKLFGHRRTMSITCLNSHAVSLAATS